MVDSLPRNYSESPNSWIFSAWVEKRAYAEFAKLDADRLRREAAEQTTEFDRAVEDEKGLEPQPSPPQQPKPTTGRKKKGRK